MLELKGLAFALCPLRVTSSSHVTRLQLQFCRLVY